MGDLGPGIGGMEYLVIAIVALVVVGPERLPMLLHKLGKLVGKARGMANEFRASFDEMARQSELDELRKEVEALRTGQGVYALGADADAAFKDIRDDLGRPYDATPPHPVLTGPEEWPDSPPVMAPLAETPPTPKPARARKPTAAKSAAIAKPKSATVKTPTTRAPRKKAVDL